MIESACVRIVFECLTPSDGYVDLVNTAADDRSISGVLHVETMGAQPAHLHVSLSDGSAVRLRRVTPNDRDALVAGFDQLSKESRYSRFFSPMPTLSGHLLDQLADLVGHCHVAIAAFEDRGEGAVVNPGLGLARAIQAHAGEPAELAVTVIDDAHGHGIGELLLRVLVVVMNEMGVNTFSASALRSNGSMLKTFAKLGARAHADPGDPSVMLVELHVAELSPAALWAPELETEILAFARSVA
jgi:GNAT superfamily N-acetyltransferase